VSQSSISLKLLASPALAENLGTIPPNSAVVFFQDGKQKRYITLNSDMTECSAINFIYKK
jgi:hypothetical protein